MGDWMSKSSRQWKKTEIDANAVVCTKRNPFSGSNGNISSSDGLSDRLYLEAKTREKHPIMTLYKETVEKANFENKIPVLVLRENESKEVLWVIEQSQLFQLIKEIDLSKLDKRFPAETTIYKMMESANSESFSLFELKNRFTIQIKQIIRNKLISNEDLEAVKSLSTMIYMIDTIMGYSRGDGDDEPK